MFGLPPLSPALIEGALKWAIVTLAGFTAGWVLSDHTRVRPIKAEFSAFVAQVQAEGAKQEVKVIEVERVIERSVEIGRKQDEDRIRDLQGKLRVALDSLRNASSARAQLKDADAAPAECRDYAAVPERLSVQDAEFLVREAARADFIALQRDACIRQYDIARRELDALADSARR